MQSKGRRINGSLRIEERRGARVWVAKHARAEGGYTRRVLGPAWAKDSGRRTPRGAVIWRTADGRKPDGYLTPQEAQEALAELCAVEARKPAGRPAVPGRTFGEATAAYLAWAEHDRGVAASTLRGYGVVARALIKEFGDGTPLRRVSVERIEAYRAGLLTEARVSRATIRHRMLVLRGILARAQRAGWIAHNPVRDVESVTLPPPPADFNVLSPVEVEAVTRAAAGDWQPVEAGERKRTRIGEQRADALTAQRRADAATYAAMIHFAAHSGLRLGELRALRWDDVNWAGRSVHVRRNAPTSSPAGVPTKAPKSGRARSVPLTDDAARTLDALSRRERWTGPDDLVFPSPSGALIDAGKARTAFYRALKLAGLGRLREKPEPITFHDLRHTFGTLAVQVFPVTDVQAMLGHADITTTMRYVHHVPRHDAAQRLSRAFATDATPGEREAAPAPQGAGA